MTSNTHTTRARQRNDRELAANEQRIEVLEAKLYALNEELTDLQAERRAILAAATALRDHGGQL